MPELQSLQQTHLREALNRFGLAQKNIEKGADALMFAGADLDASEVTATYEALTRLRLAIYRKLNDG